MLHFDDAEFATRRAKVTDAMEERGLDALLIFAPESQYWLTGYDTFGYCFFQCLVFAEGRAHLLTRSADLRQAQLTSNISDIRVWQDGTDPAEALLDMLADLGLLSGRFGVEVDTHGLTAKNWLRIAGALGADRLHDCSEMIPAFRLTKSEAELAYVREAGRLCDAAFTAGAALIQPGAEEGDILTAMQGAVFAGGGDYPGNPFIIGSGDHALLCRYATGRRTLAARDQITLEWAGVYRHYHAAAMRTLCVGEPTAVHERLFTVATDALTACEAALKPGALMRDVYAEHARIFDEAGLGAHRLAACGYALGARYAPSWMEPQMFHAGSDQVIGAGQVYFLHMILMDSETGAAMCPGRSSIVTEGGIEPLSRLPLGLTV
ncbi:Xaa-Pro dipeptidase [Rubricella aquisinus]|uniref:Xaa-Pro dipeptidase n=1 Tax=Rubricella aquisinus TaxID=2028108 RepID=A0A840X141_9RHOB|nr:Xaa-Pro peptidase family protein [Rubricella aquisinus]MBB5515596.1 Xaa-Pro dipeptidase [Rubricella aquisinus]